MRFGRCTAGGSLVKNPKPQRPEASLSICAASANFGVLSFMLLCAAWYEQRGHVLASLIVHLNDSLYHHFGFRRPVTSCVLPYFSTLAALCFSRCSCSRNISLEPCLSCPTGKIAAATTKHVLAVPTYLPRYPRLNPAGRRESCCRNVPLSIKFRPSAAASASTSTI